MIHNTVYYIYIVSTGSWIFVNGQRHMYYGTMTVFSADNLASNAVGGFKESSSAYRPCRQCLCTKNDLKSQVYIHYYTYMYII